MKGYDGRDERIWKNVCNVHDLSLCCVPKAGSTSQKAALLDSLGVPRDRLHQNEALNRTTPDLASGRTAAFVRHPWARLVGTWSHRLHGPETPVTKGFVKRGFRPGCKIGEFVDRLPEVYHLDCHTARQAVFLPAAISMLQRTEQIQDGWRALQEWHPWLADLPWFGGRYEEPDIKPTRRQRQIVEEIYADDFELWELAGG